mmetsp:Transcript_16540/g.49308  ORF Transcript_16540/g.49308 Transcript_16540/m.49308 type:complete len:110 (+) Transcript_16540:369-698(+)|eukprot:363141-Chlamydomonas_euryale.AAC.4
MLHGPTFCTQQPQIIQALPVHHKLKQSSSFHFVIWARHQRKTIKHNEMAPMLTMANPQTLLVINVGNSRFSPSMPATALNIAMENVPIESTTWAKGVHAFEVMHWQLAV